MIARQIAHVLRDLCPALSAEGMAAALGIQLRPAPCAAYRYRRSPPSVEYDALATPAEQERALQRAVVLHVLDALKLPAGMFPVGLPSVMAITEDVFGRLRSVALGQRSA